MTIAGTRQTINETTLMAYVRDDQDVRELVEDSILSVRKACRLEGMLYGSHVYGNQTEAIIVKANPEDTVKAIAQEYDMTIYCIHEINNLVGGNVVDMSGSNATVCKRFYYKYRNIA